MKRRPTKREVIIKVIAEASRAIDVAYRHPDVTVADKRKILGVLYELHIGLGNGLELTRKAQ